MRYILPFILLLVGCEQKPSNPEPCRDIKLNTFGTQACPHPDHVLETHAIKPSVCRCKKDND